MRDLEKNISYKLYKNGNEFIKDNEIYLNKDLNTHIQSAFFYVNAKAYTDFDQNNYAFQFRNKEEVLLILKKEPYNTLLLGDKGLCTFAANCLADLNLNIGHILGKQEVVLEFLDQYQKRKSGELILEHSMKIMTLNQLLYETKENVCCCDSKDLKALAECYASFQKEIFNQDISFSDAMNLLEGKENSFYAYTVNDTIVSIASKTRNDNQICCISRVFTRPEFRGKGYAKQVVSKITQSILEERKVPYLFVDSTNPISNQLYLNLGYTYLTNQVQYYFKAS